MVQIIVCKIHSSKMYNIKWYKIAGKIKQKKTGVTQMKSCDLVDWKKLNLVIFC